MVGLGEGENFLASDVSAFVEHTRRAVALGQDQVVTITPEGISVTDFDGNVVHPEEFTVDWDASAAEKAVGRASWRKKFLNSQKPWPTPLRGRITPEGHIDMPELVDVVANTAINRVVFIACGTAAYAAMLGAYAMEKWAKIPASVELSHEFRYRDAVIDQHTLVVSVSQSGETMDTLMAVRHAAEAGATTVSICNTQGATIPRESSATLYTHAGPEVAVASTKAFSAQVVATYLLALAFGEARGTLSAAERAELAEALLAAPEQMAEMVQTGERIHELAHWMADTHSVLYLESTRRLPDCIGRGTET